MKTAVFCFGLFGRQFSPQLSVDIEIFLHSILIYTKPNNLPTIGYLSKCSYLHFGKYLPRYFSSPKLDLTWQPSLVISRRALAREGDYEMMPVCACVRVRALVSHADFSKTTTATDFL